MSTKNEQGGIDVKQKNVLQKPLHQHSPPSSRASTSPAATTGYCTPSNPIAATLTTAFLDLSAKSGLDLRRQGVGPGERYCIEAARWRQAVDSETADVPRVKLECTHVAALDTVDISVLKRFAAGQDVARGVEWPKDKKSGEGSNGDWGEGTKGVM